VDANLKKLREALESTIGGMSDEEFAWHAPGKWCAAEVLEHLYLTYTGTIRGFERVLARGKPLASTPTLSNRVRTFVVVGLGHMPKGVKAPAVSVPKGLPLDKVKKEIGEKIEAMDAIIRQCEALHGGRVKVLDHPILGPLTTREWRKLHVVHGRHHQKQLLSLRQNATGKIG
jgi:hypothetical protein